MAGAEGGQKLLVQYGTPSVCAVCGQRSFVLLCVAGAGLGEVTGQAGTRQAGKLLLFFLMLDLAKQHPALQLRAQK